MHRLRPEANASCNRGVAYTPKISRAAEAIKANPQKSDRAIAAELGVSQPTVSEARKRASDRDLSPETRIGRDGKSYPIKSDASPTPRRGKDAVRERVLEALMILSGLPPAEEVAAYFSGADTAIIVSERVGAYSCAAQRASV